MLSLLFLTQTAVAILKLREGLTAKDFHFNKEELSQKLEQVMIACSEFPGACERIECEVQHFANEKLLQYATYDHAQCQYLKTALENSCTLDCENVQQKTADASSNPSFRNGASSSSSPWVLKMIVLVSLLQVL